MSCRHCREDEVMSQRLLAGTRKGLFVFDLDGGKAVAAGPHFLGEPITALLPISVDEWYVAVGHGHFGAHLHYTSDAGVNFRELTAPAYPPKPEGVEDLDPVRNQPIPWTVQQIWVLAPGGPAAVSIIPAFIPFAWTRATRRW